MNYLLLVTVIFGASLINSSWASEFCPQDELVKPCVCEKDPDTNQLTLVCDEYWIRNDEFDALFKRLSGRGLKFHELIIGQTKIYELGPNQFQDVQFEKITLDNLNKVERIHKLAFNGIANNLISFKSRDAPLGYYTPSADYNIYQALSACNNLRYIDIEGSGYLTQVDDHAFESLRKLCLLKITRSGLSKIGKNVLVQSVRESDIVVDFSKNKITEIAADAFNNQRGFFLNVSYNKLTEVTFHKDVFHIDFFAPEVSLDIRGNAFKHLPEATFQWLLKLDILSTGPRVLADPLDCQSCANWWLFSDDKYARHFPAFKCADGLAFDYRKHFHKC
ncbi:unnamed protein product [Medioppia subpectinata]|uniref:Uncharacterized protein n=1 Tax=Medioppia subpectinata TaxID=1979941 RepID=A0A7R9LJ23_9ACAR|nr:unnamed protein product [Medioppia subpectinata]CAG2118657.1 unnamed protein product [Medioppia subpectinata]